MAMKKHFTELYNSYAEAEESEKEWKRWFGYSYKIVRVEYSDKFELICDIEETLMG